MPALLVNVDVPDLEAATAFYARVFGLSVGRRFSGAVELLGAGAPIYLLEKSAGTLPFPSGTPRSYARHWSPVHLDFVVHDVDATVEKAVAAGATVESPAADAVWGRIAMLADPWGNGFCVLRFHGRGYDEIAR